MYIMRTLFFALANISSANIAGAGFITCTEARHQGAIKIFWLYFWGAVLLSIFMTCHPNIKTKREGHKGRVRAVQTESESEGDGSSVEMSCMSVSCKSFHAIHNLNTPLISPNSALPWNDRRV